MLDLIFVINSRESRKLKILVLEIYSCRNISNKNGKYSGGIIQKININNLDKCNNISEREMKKLKNFLSKYAYNITLYQFLLDWSNIKELFNIINEKEMFYYWDYKNNFIKILNIELISKYDKHIKDEISNLSNIDMLFRKSLFTLYFFNINNNINQVLIKIAPEAKVFFYSPNLNKCILKFNYNGIEINSDSKQKIIKSTDKIIARDYITESEYTDLLKHLNFRREKNNEYGYFGARNKTDLLNDLVDKNFKVLFFHHNNETNNAQPQIKITDSGYDWFDIDINYKFNNEIYNLANKIDLSTSKKYVTINNNIIKLPESICNQLDKLSLSTEGKLYLPKKYFWSFLQIASESNQDITNFINYDSILVEVNEIIKRIIKPYQITGVKWLKWLFINGLGGCLADDMGLGKTLEVISMLSDKEIKGKINNILIIVPKSILSNWAREFSKFCDEYNICIYHGEKRDGLLSNKSNIYITTYNTATNDISDLLNIFFDIVIFDEIQYIKNFNTKTYKTLRLLNSKVRIGLSGTPMENDIEELWNVLDMLNPGMLSSKIKFKKRYANGKNGDELHKLLTPFLLRRTKAEVLKELPKKIEETLYCDFGVEQRILYDSIREALKNEMSKSSVFNNAIVLKGLLLLRETCCHPQLLPESVNINNTIESCKFETLKYKVRELYNNGHKVLVFSQFTKMLKIIQEWLVEEKFSQFYLDGKTKNRQDIIDDFERAKCGIFLISLKAGGVGLNLACAQDVIIYDPWWNPFVERQAEDRAFRLGQEKNVTVYKMIVANSIEEKILDMQNNKKEIFEFVISGISNDKNIDLMEIVNLLNE